MSVVMHGAGGTTAIVGGSGDGPYALHMAFRMRSVEEMKGPVGYVAQAMRLTQDPQQSPLDVLASVARASTLPPYLYQAHCEVVFADARINERPLWFSIEENQTAHLKEKGGNIMYGFVAVRVTRAQYISALAVARRLVAEQVGYSVAAAYRAMFWPCASSSSDSVFPTAADGCFCASLMAVVLYVIGVLDPQRDGVPLTAYSPSDLLFVTARIGTLSMNPVLRTLVVPGMPERTPEEALRSERLVNLNALLLQQSKVHARWTQIVVCFAWALVVAAGLAAMVAMGGHRLE